MVARWMGEKALKCRRYSAKYGSWRDEGIVHAVRHGATVCGYRVGREQDGWLPADWRDEVDCKRCLSAIDSEKGRQ